MNREKNLESPPPFRSIVLGTLEETNKGIQDRKREIIRMTNNGEWERVEIMINRESNLSI